ncbi:entericidin EcnA/B family protein [Rhodovulum tesquicola]|nr:entericidin EcnA/B family protein [Rhodovulum tesquicola]MCO8144360.1 entericidin EcnA/B family protein [Rhodovulum tesquicola]
MTRTLLMLGLLALAGCGTVEGIGEDISAGARAVRNVF